MKIDCGLTAQEKREAQEEWHRWFAWRPVRLGSRDCRWLEYVERRRISQYNPLWSAIEERWVYREAGKGTSHE